MCNCGFGSSAFNGNSSIPATPAGPLVHMYSNGNNGINHRRGFGSIGSTAAADGAGLLAFSSQSSKSHHHHRHHRRSKK